MRPLLIALLLVLIPHPLAIERGPAQVASRHESAQIFLATAYVATGHRCKDGSWPVVGKTIAVDPSIIPLGSKVQVNGVEMVARDTGALIRGRHVDLFVGSRGEAVS
jgi:3D (Asp-Asp-Asp) domain-containing protein